MIKSHIQMPKFLMKYFEDQEHRLYYYDVRKDVLGTKGSAASINTEYGYYSETMEKVLNSLIEDPFAKLVSKINRVCFDYSEYSLSKDDIGIIHRFIQSLISRNPITQEVARDNSVFFQFLPKQDQHNYVVAEVLENKTEITIIKDMLVARAINLSNIPFVLTTSGIVGFTINSIPLHLLPISPQKAIVLFEEKYKNKQICQDLIFFSEDSHIREINNAAFIQQMNMKTGFVMSGNQIELKRLLETSKAE